MAKKLTPQEIEQIRILSDPVAWAESTLKDPKVSRKPFRLRDYQKEMLWDPSKRKVSRMGRRTGKSVTMATHILWYAFTNENSKQVIATPYDSQVTVIFNMIKDFITNTPEIEQSIEVMNKSPYHLIKLKNGSMISGFTAGTRSGAAGGSLRGQAADWVYMDEVDYMSDADFETIYAIALEAPQRIGVWISSTPTGRRGKFWACCQQGSGWREFYYPTMVNPEWSPSLEKELRSIYSEQGYTHEVLAEFGDETIGVFKKGDIDRARQEYHYTGVPTKQAIRCVGVDWDKVFVPIKWCELLETPKAA